MIPDLTNPWVDRRVAWVIAAAVFLASAASFVILLSGLASGQPEAAAEIPWLIWLGALCAILLVSCALAFWLTPGPARGVKRSWAVYGMTFLLVAWLPLAGMIVLLLRMTDVSRTEFRFSSVLREIEHLDPDGARQDMYRNRVEAPADPGSMLPGPGLVVVRAGVHGESVALWSGTVGRMERRAANLAELGVVAVIYRFDNVLACAVIDWPRRHTIEWYEWRDIPDRYMVQEVHNAHLGYGRRVVTFPGGPQWDALLKQLGHYKSPDIMGEKTLITLAVLYVAGLLLLIGVVTVSGIRRLQARA